MNKIEEYVHKNTWKIKENSNENYSLSGLQSYIAGGILSKDYINQSPLKDLHLNNKIHIHDAKYGVYAPYCNGLNLNSLLTQGLINPVGASSQPAKHFDTIMSQMVNMLYIAQVEFAGAQAFSDVDSSLAPFIREDGLDYDDIKQVVQRTVYDINYPLRSSYQTPFINFTFNVIVPQYMKDQAAIMGGKSLDTTYGDYQKESDLLNMAFLDVMMEGNLGKPFTFPIPTYVVGPDFPWESPVVDRIFDLTCKFGLPYFANYCGTKRDASVCKSMCCRLSLDLSSMVSSAGGWWDIGANTGSIAVTTINLPLLGYQSKGSKSAFYDDLDYYLQKCYEHHEWKRTKVEEGFKIGLMPFTAEYMENFDTYFSTIGTIGMNEMCQNMFGKDINECEDFVIDVLKFMSEKCKEFSEKSGHLYNLEEIPAEGICYSMALHDKENYSDCYTQGLEEDVYYTNSSHTPVNSDLGPIENIILQNKFKQIYTGGTLYHLFVGEAAPDRDGVKELIKNLCENTQLPYVAFTKSYAICEKCGMTDDLSEICPKCGGDTDVYSRVTGFYRPIKSYNRGKLAEFKDRKHLNVKEFRK